MRLGRDVKTGGASEETSSARPVQDAEGATGKLPGHGAVAE